MAETCNRPMLQAMDEIVLTGAEKSKLRGRGQQIDAQVKIGKEGVTPAVVAEMRRFFREHDLLKVRFVGSDPGTSGQPFCPELSRATESAWVGSVGATALFYLPRPGEPDSGAIPS